jgi:hypothetical protein
MDCCSELLMIILRTGVHTAYVWSSFNFFKILFVLTLTLKLHISFLFRITKSDMDCMIHPDLTVTFHDQK